MTEPALEYDAATAQLLGARQVQQDAIATQFTLGAEPGLVVLADGMGGHTAGEIASKIAVTEVFSEICLKGDALVQAPETIPEALRNAALCANTCLRHYIELNPETAGMGSTLVATLHLAGRLYWVSVGDSVLFLLRDGTLSRLNADHSMAPQIDLLASKGQMSADEARRHPMRSCLASALTGQEVAQIDCPELPFALRPGDVVVIASDGLEYLPQPQIAEILGADPARTASDIARSLAQAIDALQDAEQDNATFAVVRVDAAAEPASLASAQDTSGDVYSRLRRMAGSLI